MSDKLHTAYVLRDEDGVALYVGCTSRLEHRIREHKANQPWGDQIAWANSTTFPTKKAAEMAEYLLIDEHQPLHNERKRELPWQVRAVLDAQEANA